MWTKLIRIIIFIFLTTSIVESQDNKRSNIWYFGIKAGVNFNTTPPSSLNDGELNTGEGCATLCDKNGDLLIYTDGSSIWNKKHKIIPNAIDLGGGSSSTQSSIIVPKPGSNNLVFVFSVSVGGPSISCEIFYSIIDISQNNGLGGLVRKKVQISNNAIEKITSIQQCNGKDFWIISHEKGNDIFLVWELTENGLTVTPNKQNIGRKHVTKGYIGYLKASIDGTKLVEACLEDNYIEVFDFDIEIGKISENFDFDNSNSYGVEFSPDGNLLYFSGFSGSGVVYQMDLTLPTVTEIINSQTIIAFVNGINGYRAIQIASNGKIYFANGAFNYLSEITFPNRVGLACNYIEQGVQLGQGICLLGLPNLISSLILPKDSIITNTKIDVCNYIAELSIEVIPPYNNLNFEWYFNNQHIGKDSSKIKVNESGKYEVLIRVPLECNDSISYKEYRKEFNISINDSLNALINIIKQPLCQNDNGEININAHGGTLPYRYSIDGGVNFQASNIFKNLSKGPIDIIVKDKNDCLINLTTILRDTTNLEFQDVIITHTQCDFSNGSISIVMVDKNKFFEYALDNQKFQAQNLFVNVDSGKHTVTVRDKNGCTISAEVLIKPGTSPKLILMDSNNEICDMNNGELIVLGIEGTPPYVYSIDGNNFSSSMQFTNLSANTDYTIYVKDSLGCIYDTIFTIDEIEGPAIDSIFTLAPKCMLDNGQITVLASGGTAPLQYSIDQVNFVASNQFNNIISGKYLITVKDSNDCIAEQQVEIFDKSVVLDYSSKIIPATCNLDNGAVTLIATKDTLKLEYSIDMNVYFKKAIFNNLAGGKHIIYIRDEDGCIDEIELNIHREEVVTIKNIIIINSSCDLSNGQITVQINGTNDVEYSINGTDFFMDSTFSNLSPGNYQTTIKDRNGCLDMDNIIIMDETSLLLKTVDFENTSCGNDNGTLTILATGDNLTYSINNTDFSDQNSYKNLASGNYEILIKDENDCIEMTFIQILDSKPIDIDKIVISPPSCDEQYGKISFQLEGGTAPFKIEVNNKEVFDGFQLDELERGYYSIIIIDELGCEIDTLIGMPNKDCSVYIPNSFSPNGDGINDIFRIYPFAGFEGEIESINIYDRWGNLVYYATDFNPVDEGWNGSLDGKDLNPGVFVYYILLENGELYKGNLTLLR